MYSFLAFTWVRIQDPPRKSKNPLTTDHPSLNKTNLLVFFFSLHQHCDGSCYFVFPFVSLNTTPHGSKTSSNCPAVFVLLSIEDPSAVFLFLGLRSEFSKPRSTNPRKVRNDIRNIPRHSARSNGENWPEISLSYTVSRRIISLQY
jgi:hypothetical protein